MNPAAIDDQRRFNRIPFSATVDLSQADRHWSVELLDLSLKGALVEKPSDWQKQETDDFELDISLSGSDQHIHMQCRISHVDPARLGFQCLHIDIDSMSHLRRLVELNLGDESLLERDLSALV